MISLKHASAVALAALTVGCSNGGASPTAGILPPPQQVTLADVQTRVFSPSCALSGCHLGSGAPFGLDLSAGHAAGNTVGVSSAEVPGLLRVEPFNAADSYLYMKLAGDPRILGDPMPATGGPLSAANLSLVQTWIDQGAQ